MWPRRVSIAFSDGRLKMRRFYLVGSGDTLGVMLHQFVADEEEGTLHDHPWRWGVSLMLSGGYFEERLDGAGRRRTRWVAPGRLNVVRGDRFHRVALRAGRPAWTLFLHGPRARPWGFLDVVTRAFRPFVRPQSSERAATVSSSCA
ncbi:MAG: hypothetical protein JWM53_3390 [bacterium]|nr:hypothetical protein [bacterium]